MIVNWHLRNFKSVYNQTISLRPLTVLSGVNSSGKSTILQSMALIAQTLSNQVEREALLLNGHLMSLGEFRNVRSASSTDRSFSVGWDIKPNDAPLEALNEDELGLSELYATNNFVDLKSISCSVTFGSRVAGRPEVIKGELQVEPDKRDRATIEWARSPNLTQSEIESKGNQWEVRLDSAFESELHKRHVVAGSARCELRHFLPSRLLVQIQTEARNSEFRARVLCQKRRALRIAEHPLLNFAVQPDVVECLKNVVTEEYGSSTPVVGATFATWTEWLAAICQTHPELEQKLVATTDQVLSLLLQQPSATRHYEHTSLPAKLGDAVFYLETFFATKFRYLGPLRDEPRAIYPYPTKLDPVDLGRRGEYTAAAYHAYADTSVLHLDYAELVQWGPIARKRIASLRTAVNEWLRYLGVADHLMSGEDKYGHTLEVGTSEDADWDMIHVGTGVSQVLPILVLGLLSQVDDVLVIEHPELHLHPAVQTRLADFFLFLALNGRQTIIETHSEYILHRLRHRIVAPGGEGLREKIGILFANVEDGITQFRDVVINEYGAIERWPDGFFDAAAVEAEEILRKAIAKEGSG